MFGYFTFARASLVFHTLFGVLRFCIASLFFFKSPSYCIFLGAWQSLQNNINDVILEKNVCLWIKMSQRKNGGHLSGEACLSKIRLATSCSEVEIFLLAYIDEIWLVYPLMFCNCLADSSKRRYRQSKWQYLVKRLKKSITNL